MVWFQKKQTNLKISSKNSIRYPCLKSVRSRFKWENKLSLLVFDHKSQSFPISHCFHLGLLIQNGFFRLIRFLTAVETDLVEAMVDLVWTHIKFTNIRPLEGNEGVFICILCRFSRILTTRSAKRPTYGHFLRLVDSCINLEKFGPIQRSVDSCIPSKIRTDSAVRGFLYSFSKVGPIQWSVDLSLKIHTDSAVRGFLRLI